jgi:predicted metalloprotease with PDZ domain
MATTRPGDIPELLKDGWPTFVRSLQISDTTGQPVEVASASKAGWELKQAHEWPLTLTYEVDYSLPASLGWPAPRELAFSDSAHIMVVGRSLFITTPDVSSSIVTFSLPDPWRAVTPWIPAEGSENAFVVDVTEDLVTNLIVLTQTNRPAVRAANFQVLFTPMGHWQEAGADVERVLRGVIQHYVELMQFEGRAEYSVVLLPMQEFAGEAYRNSFALSLDTVPSSSNLPRWGRLIAHEIYHYWNGLRLRGSDYASSQWFQEGFTDYVADLAMVNSGLVSPADFRRRLAHHIHNYLDLSTPLNAPGDHKGPPLYGGGALVAFCWDVQIRHSTGGRHSIGDFLRTLWRQTQAGQREYGWEDIRGALEATAPLDWNTFYLKYIHGTDKLPLAAAFSQAGLNVVEASDGTHVEHDLSASTSMKALWQALVEGR